LWVLLFGQKS